jgi:hypothetical protein
MNALLFIAGVAPLTWSVNERRAGGRRLGTVQQWPKNGFVVEPDRSGPLNGVERGPHANLDAAMEAVERQIRGSCELWSPLRRPLAA